MAGGSAREILGATEQGRNPYSAFLMDIGDMLKSPELKSEDLKVIRDWSTDTSIINESIWTRNLPKRITNSSGGDRNPTSNSKDGWSNTICGDLGFGTSIGELGAIVSFPVVHLLEYYLAQAYENFDDADLLSGQLKNRTSQLFRTNPEQWSMYLAFLDIFKQGKETYTPTGGVVAANQIGKAEDEEEDFDDLREGYKTIFKYFADYIKNPNNMEGIYTGQKIFEESKSNKETAYRIMDKYKLSNSVKEQAKKYIEYEGDLSKILKDTFSDEYKKLYEE